MWVVGILVVIILNKQQLRNLMGQTFFFHYVAIVVYNLFHEAAT
jgi:hypothetical protein